MIIIKNGQSAGKSFAYILGVALSDGCITKEYGKYVFRLECMDEDYVDAFYDSLSNYGVSHLRRYKIVNPRYNQGYSYFVVTRDLDLINLILNDTVFRTVIPSYVYRWSNENRVSFISAVMDGEGYVSKRTKIMGNGLPSYSMGIEMSYSMLLQFKKILQSVGVVTGKFTFRSRYQNVKLACLSIKIRSWYNSGCYFMIKRKNDKVLDYIRNTNLNDYTPKFRNIS